MHLSRCYNFPCTVYWQRMYLHFIFMPPFYLFRGDSAKPEIYHPKDKVKEAESHGIEDSSISPGKESLLVKDETFPELAPGRSSVEVC